MSAELFAPDTTLGAAHLIVADLDRSVAFYIDTLGFREVARQGDTAYLDAGDGAGWLRLTALAGARRKPRRTTGLYHIAILTPDRPALARALRHIAEASYPLTGASDHLVSEALYLNDPDGNGLEIYRDRPRREWPVVRGQIQMDSLPLDLEGLLAEGLADERPWAGLEPATHLGHVHLHVADLDAAVQFYSAVLGFEVMVRMGDSAAFLAAGGYHHHLGLNTWAGVGAPPPPADAVGIKDFEIVLPNAAERDHLRARLDRAGLAPEERGAALALRDPSGNGVLLRVAER